MSPELYHDVRLIGPQRTHELLAAVFLGTVLANQMRTTLIGRKDLAPLADPTFGAFLLVLCEASLLISTHVAHNSNLEVLYALNTKIVIFEPMNKR